MIYVTKRVVFHLIIPSRFTKVGVNKEVYAGTARDIRHKPRMLETDMTTFLTKEPLENGARFVLGNGYTIEVDLGDLPEDIVRRLAVHGMIQKGGDATSGANGDYAFAQAAIESTIASLQQGDWNRGRTPAHSDLIAAVRVVYGKTEEEAKAVVLGMSDEAIKELKKVKPIKAEMAEARARREKSKAAGAEVPSLDDIIQRNSEG